MPKGPKGEKRPADVISNAVKVMRIATGEENDTLAKVAPARSKGAKARSVRLSETERSDIARIAAEARWKKGDLACCRFHGHPVKVVL